MVSIVQPTHGIDQVNVKTAQFNAYDGRRQFPTSRNRFWWVNWQVVASKPDFNQPN